MMKKDGKEIYTFTGLINRMDACRNRDYKFSEKDIPEEVVFRETVYKLSNDKKFYYDQRTGVTLAEVVGEAYGDDIFKFLTEHEFVVIKKQEAKLTSEEKEFIRMCNLMLGGRGIDRIKITLDHNVLELYFKKETRDDLLRTGQRVISLPIESGTFEGLQPDVEYSLRDLKIYE